MFFFYLILIITSSGLYGMKPKQLSRNISEQILNENNFVSIHFHNANFVTDTEIDKNLTPLMVAAKNGNVAAIKKLVLLNANIDEKQKGITNTQSQLTEYVNWTPLAFAALSGKIDAVISLLNHGAKIDVLIVYEQQEKSLIEALKIQLQKTISLGKKKQYEKIITLLQRFFKEEIACEIMSGNFNSINKDNVNKRMPLSYGKQTFMNQTPLMIAIQLTNDTIKNVKAILKSNPDLELRTRGASFQNNFTALAFAVAQGNAKIVQLLLEHGANKNVTVLNLGNEINLTQLASLNNHKHLIPLLESNALTKLVTNLKSLKTKLQSLQNRLTELIIK